MQIMNIVAADNRAKRSKSKKLNKIVTSLYDYKSKSNYCNRMKIISSIINQ